MQLRTVLLAVSVALVVVGGTAGCTSQAAPTPTASASASADPEIAAAAARLPSCDDVANVLGPVATGLSYDETSSTSLDEGSSGQRSCAFTSADNTDQLLVLATVSPLSSDQLGTLRAEKTTIADPRSTAIDSVLQTSKANDGPSSHLDSVLLLVGPTYTLVLGAQSTGTDAAAAFPSLTVAAAADALFNVRALIG